MARIKIYEVVVNEVDATTDVETRGVMRKTLYATDIVAAYTFFTSKITLPSSQHVSEIRYIATINKEFNPA